MPEINLFTIGSVKVTKKLKTIINISSEELFDKYPEISSGLSFESKDLIRLAMDDGLEPQLRKKKDEILAYFEAVESQMLQLGFGSEEAAEKEEAEELKGEEMDASDIPEQKDQDTFDEESKQKEGRIIIGDQQMDSKLVPIKIKEKIALYQERDGTLSTSKETTRKGIIEILNNSDKDRLWDIDLKFENVSQTDIQDESFPVEELDPEASKEFEYTFEADVESKLAIEEFISTVGDPDIESYSLAVGAENEIFMRIKIKNTEYEEVSSIGVFKFIPDEFANPQILAQSTGSAEIKDKDGKNYAHWEIEKLEGNEEATLDLRLNVYIESKETKIRTGEIAFKYLTPESASGIEIGSFDAYTNNSFNIVTSEIDDEPNKYECKFIFENPSEFMIRLVNADVYNEEDTSIKYVDIDPNDIPEIPAGGKWESNVWSFTAEDGEYPTFKTKVEFFAIADHQIATKVKVNIVDIELAVAALEGVIGYGIEKLPSFKITPFTLSGKVTNTGGASLNEVTLVENIQAEFLPPKPSQVEVYLNGNIIDVPADAIKIEPDDQDPTVEHTVTVTLENLKDSDAGPLQPEENIEFKYPITAYNPTKETLYKADAILTANTFPPGKPIEIRADPIEIMVEHIRRNIAKGKDIQALDTEGEFEITLSIKNMGESELTNYRLKEKVAAGLILSDVSHEAKISEKEGNKILAWKFETIAPNEVIKVTYKISPSAEAKISETQKDD